MIFYFSGTGNSQLAAKIIAETTGDKIVSINQCLKDGGQTVYRSQKPFVFVTPTYAWRLPRVVEQWIHKTGFEGSRDAYFVMTCDGSCGNAGAYSRKLCKDKQLHCCGTSPVFMPENYLAMFDTPDESKCRTKVEAAKPRIAELAALIREGRPFPEVSVSFGDKVQSGPVNQLFYPLFVHDKGFRAADACISCGKCAKRCPLNNIEMTDKKPVWNGNCTHCMACIAGCPVQAIEYKEKSRGKHRHFILED